MAASILIVDDEEPVRDLIKEVLKPHGYLLTTADGAKNALAIIHRQPLDLAIIDRNMPGGLGGLDLLKLIRSNPKTAALKVLMCTAASMTRDIDEAFQAGADDYILKPLNFPTLLAKVARVLAKPPRKKT